MCVSFLVFFSLEWQNKNRKKKETTTIYIFKQQIVNVENEQCVQKKKGRYLKREMVQQHILYSTQKIVVNDDHLVLRRKSSVSFIIRFVKMLRKEHTQKQK